MTSPTTIIYGSKLGHSKKVAAKIAEKLHISRTINAREISDLATLESDKIGPLCLVASTWGDGELQDDMEALLLRSSNLKGRKICLVELGNYYGYDDFEFGALAIMEATLQNLGAEVISRLSLDSLPKIDWDTLEAWLTSQRVA